jgi:ubiquinone/menaquinone biosynthesis C-methylase UbiE
MMGGGILFAKARGKMVSISEKTPFREARLTQAEIKTVYDRLSGVYNLWARIAESKARQRALELAEIRDGQSVLEVAVGTGLAFEEIVKRNPHGRNIGLDISEGMLTKAKQRLAKCKQGNYELKPGSAFEIPYPPASFDILLNNYLFDLIPSEEMGRIVKEFWRVLKPGGTLVLANMTLPKSWTHGFYEKVYNFSPKLMGGCRGVQMAEGLARQGFRVEPPEYITQFGFPSEVLRARKGPTED